MRVRHDIGQAVHALHRNVGRPERLDPFGRRAPLHLVSDEGIGGVVVLAPHLLRREAGIRCHVGATDDLEVSGPLLVVVDQRADIAILRLVRPPVGGEHARVARLAMLRLEGVAAEMLAEHDLQQVLEHRHVDPLAFSRLLSVVERRAHRARHLLADRAVRDDDRRVARCFRALHLEERRNPRRALDEIVVRRIRRVRPALAVAEAADVDDARIHRPHIRVGELEPRHRLRSDVVDQHIGALRER